MKNREERPTNLDRGDRGATQRTFDFGNEDESELPANFLRPEVTDPAFADTPSLSVSSEIDLLEQVVDPENLVRAWQRVKKNRGAPGPDGMTIKQFENWCPEHWPAIQQQLLDGTFRPAPVRRKTIPKDGGGRHRRFVFSVPSTRRSVPCYSTSFARHPTKLAKRARSSHSTSHLPGSDADLRSGILRIEFRFSPQPIGSWSREAGSADHPATTRTLHRR